MTLFARYEALIAGLALFFGIVGAVFAGTPLRILVDSFGWRTVILFSAAATLLGTQEAYRAVPWFWSDQGDVKLQMVGLSMNATASVVRGKPDDGAFSVFHYQGDRLVAIDSVNRAADHMVGRRMLAAGMNLPPEQAADESVDLKALLKK